MLIAAGRYALDRSLAGNGLVARVLVDRFADYITANRQATHNNLTELILRQTVVRRKK